jgi:hypothetical protein
MNCVIKLETNTNYEYGFSMKMVSSVWLHSRTQIQFNYIPMGGNKLTSRQESDYMTIIPFTVCYFLHMRSSYYHINNRSWWRGHRKMYKISDILHQEGRCQVNAKTMGDWQHCGRKSTNKVVGPFGLSRINEMPLAYLWFLHFQGQFPILRTSFPDVNQSSIPQEGQLDLTEG